MKTAEKKEVIIKRVMEIAVSATSISLSIFTNLFHQRFSKHVYLESTLEISQQFNFEMNSYHTCYCSIPGDLCKYTLKCVYCQKNITDPGTIGETLHHAPIVMLRCWEMIGYQDHQINPPSDFDITHVALLCSGMDSFQRAQASFQATLTDRGNNYVMKYVIQVEKKTNSNFVKRLKFTSQKRRRQIFKPVLPPQLH